MQAHAEPGGVLCDVKLLSGFARPPHEVASGKLVKINQAAVGKRPAPRCDQRQAILAENKTLDRLGQRLLGGKAEIGAAGGDRGCDLRALALLDIDVDVGILAQERSEGLRQMLRDPRGSPKDARLPARLRQSARSPRMASTLCITSRA